VSDQDGPISVAATRPAGRRLDGDPVRPVDPPLSTPADFMAGEDTRVRDLLAFALAAEAAQPVSVREVASFRARADAELEQYAFRTLHNRVEAIRAEALQDGMMRLRGGPGLPRLVLANLLALGIAAAAALAWPHLLPLLARGG
jgi:hypothetical protein